MQRRGFIGLIAALGGLLLGSKTVSAQEDGTWSKGWASEVDVPAKDGQRKRADGSYQCDFCGTIYQNSWDHRLVSFSSEIGDYTTCAVSYMLSIKNATAGKFEPKSS